jgi:hypothetical protein
MTQWLAREPILRTRPPQTLPSTPLRPFLNVCVDVSVGLFPETSTQTLGFPSDRESAPLSDVNQEIAALARHQDGLITDAQVRTHASTDWQRRELFRSGWLERVGPRTYAVAGAPRTHRFELRQGLLMLGEHSVVSYEAAAALHHLDRPVARAVEFTVARRARPGHTNLVVHTTNRLPAIDIVTVEGFRTTSATRTILDLAHARARRARVEAAIDSAVRLGLSAPHTIERRLETLRGSGRWGCRLIEDLVIDSGGHSMLERRFLELVRRSGLPRPLTQAVHRKGARPVARVDFLFKEQQIVIEVSGQHGHSSPTDRAKDAQRRNELQDLGMLVFEYTYADVTQRGAMVARTLRERLR